MWLSWLVSWTTVGWVTPAASTAVVAWATVRVGEVTSHDWPPLKSMPRLRPRVPSEMTPSRMIDGRDAEPPPAVADEVERGLAPVEADEDVVALLAPLASGSRSSAANSSSSSKASSSSAAASSSDGSVAVALDGRRRPSRRAGVAVAAGS